MFKKVLIIMTILCSNLAAAHSTGNIHWSYEGNSGPNFWGGLDHSFKACRDGKEQSPLNIPDKVANKAYDLQFSYAPTAIILKLTQHNLYENVINTTKEYLLLNKQAYHLHGLHFHTPSEHQLNTHEFPLEAHLVHRNKHGEYLVLGIFIQKGKANAYLEQLYQAGIPTKESEEIRTTHLDQNLLLPAINDFYVYKGSLTTPPCAENVTWLLMKNPIEASEEQIEYFKTHVMTFNARPLQNLNKREIFLNNSSGN